MTEISYDRAIPEPGPRRKGLAQTLRIMRRGGSIEIPQAKKASVYTAARAAGAKVRIQTTNAGTIIVWRIDGRERPQLPRTEDELRPFYVGYTDRHSMQAGIDVLESFGCDFLSEAIELDAAKLGALVEALTEDEGIFE